MDDPNYKMKNIYSSVSPSEIALRCTILDLCQRLKRTEVLCDYYEQCRNELVSDCIRLRQERDYYLMAHRNNLQVNIHFLFSKLISKGLGLYCVYILFNGGL